MSVPSFLQTAARLYFLREICYPIYRKGGMSQ